MFGVRVAQAEDDVAPDVVFLAAEEKIQIVLPQDIGFDAGKGGLHVHLHARPPVERSLRCLSQKSLSQELVKMTKTGLRSRQGFRWSQAVLNLNKMFPDTSETPSKLSEVKGMIGQGERRLLYAMTRFGFEGIGTIVDAGAFVGSSAYCMAAGLSESPFKDGVKIHSYDLFIAQFPDVVDAISTLVRPIQIGESYLDIFEHQLAEFSDSVVVHQGDFCTKEWRLDSKIEILFVDICKSPQLNRHLITTFVPSLVPNKSVLLQQDFLHVWHPYVHWSMEILSPYFDIELSLVDATRVYRLIRSIPEAELRRACGDGVSTEEKIDLLRRMGERGPEWVYFLSEVLLLRQLAADRQWERFDLQWETYSSQYGSRILSDAPNDWFMRQASLIQKVSLWERKNAP